MIEVIATAAQTATAPRRVRVVLKSALLEARRLPARQRRRVKDHLCQDGPLRRERHVADRQAVVPKHVGQYRYGLVSRKHSGLGRRHHVDTLRECPQRLALPYAGERRSRERRRLIEPGHLLAVACE